jgi:pyrroline-5-carboxylate reductase
MAAFPLSLVLVGAGKMGGAMLEGWLKLGLSGERVAVIDPQPSAELAALCASHASRLNPPLAELAEPAVLVLAVKPQMLDLATPALAQLAGPQTLVISVIAGKTVDDLLARLKRVSAVVRAMPNTPASVGRGITGAFANSAVGPAERAMTAALLGAIGQVEWVDREALIDVVTAVSGSGPAYVFYLTECLAEAGVAAGLAPDLAQRLARATVEGAGELMHQQAATPPSTLRQNVTSPAGTTAAALQVLMDANAGLPDLMVRAVAAAKRRASELSG